MEQREDRDREKRQKGTEEEDKEHRHLPLLVVHFLKALRFS